MSNSLSAVHPELIAEWSEKIDILKEHLCKQRGIKLIKLPMKPNEVEPEYAQRIKAAFQSVHIFISSDTEEDVKIPSPRRSDSCGG